MDNRTILKYTFRNKSKKNDEKLLVFHVEQKTEFEKFNFFFINFF